VVAFIPRAGAGGGRRPPAQPENGLHREQPGKTPEEIFGVPHYSANAVKPLEGFKAPLICAAGNRWGEAGVFPNEPSRHASCTVRRMANKEASLANQVVLPGARMPGRSEYPIVPQRPESLRRVWQRLELPVPGPAGRRIDQEKPRVVHARFQDHELSPHHPNEYEL